MPGEEFLIVGNLCLDGLPSLINNCINEETPPNIGYNLQAAVLSYSGLTTGQDGEQCFIVNGSLCTNSDSFIDMNQQLVPLALSGNVFGNSMTQDIIVDWRNTNLIKCLSKINRLIFHLTTNVTFVTPVFLIEKSKYEGTKIWE